MLRSLLDLALPLLLLMGTVGCAGTAGPSQLFDPATINAERDEWRGEKSGRVYLRRAVRGIVDTAVDPARAESRVEVHLAVTRFGAAAEAEAITLAAPPEAQLSDVRARLIAPAGTADTMALDTRETPGRTVDPNQRHWTLTFAPLGDAQVLEVVATFTVAGSLPADARYLSVPDGPTAELLLRYDVPSDAVGSFIVVGHEARALVTDKDGFKVIALLLSDLPAGASAAFARYVTTRADPKGHQQDFASSWAVVARSYQRRLVDASLGFREGYSAPFTPTAAGRDAILQTYQWVRDRIQRQDATESSWDAGRPLIQPIAANDLTATDKIHLLHWLLDAAGITHRFAVARTSSLPSIPGSFPTPSAFHDVLIHVPAYDLWLDPACQSCEAGQLRPSLRGGQALRLPADGSGPVTLP